MHSSLLTFQIWSRDFTISDDNEIMVPMWVEFSSLSLPYWPFIEYIANTLGKVITKEHKFLFKARSQKCVCIEVDIFKDLKVSMEI